MYTKAYKREVGIGNAAQNDRRLEDDKIPTRAKTTSRGDKYCSIHLIPSAAGWIFAVSPFSSSSFPCCCRVRMDAG